MQIKGDPSARAMVIARAVEFARLEWVDWLNNYSLLSFTGNVPPTGAETAYDASLEELMLAA